MVNGVRGGVHSHAQKFAEVRKMFLNPRHAEQDVRERRASRKLLSLFHVRMKLPDKREVGSSTLPRPIGDTANPRNAS